MGTRIAAGIGVGAAVLAAPAASLGVPAGMQSGSITLNDTPAIHADVPAPKTLEQSILEKVSELGGEILNLTEAMADGVKRKEAGDEVEM